MSASSMLENANPLIFQRSGARLLTSSDEDEDVHDPIDDREIFDLIRSINDPEHPLSLEELNVVEQDRVQVNDADSTVGIEFTPTIPHCSMATLIGLSIKVKLLRSLPHRFKIDVHITPGTHASEDAETSVKKLETNQSNGGVQGSGIKKQGLDQDTSNVVMLMEQYRNNSATANLNPQVNKQLADKERVAAALENSQLLEVVNQCLSTKSP